MPYHPIKTPFLSLDIRNMSKKELKSHFNWFLEIIPERMKKLARTVRETPGFEGWKSDCTPDSLGPLGEWLGMQVETRPVTNEEILEFEQYRQEQLKKFKGNFNQESLLKVLEPPNEKLTDRTVSIIMDVGIYLSQVLMRNHLTLRWELPLGSKRFVDYGRPVLAGFGRVSMNPMTIVANVAGGTLSKKRTGGRLRELYDIWSKDVGHVA